MLKINGLNNEVPIPLISLIHYIHTSYKSNQTGSEELKEPKWSKKIDQIENSNNSHIELNSGVLRKRGKRLTQERIGRLGEQDWVASNTQQE